MKNFIFLLVLVIATLSLVNIYGFLHPQNTSIQKPESKENEYWFVLFRNKNVEHLYKGTPGDASRSQLIRTFTVKTGTPGESPTPIPTRAGRKYWVVNGKFETKDNPETAPYFIQLDVPGGDIEPYYGPVPYEECDGQCAWRLAGPFGLHGVSGDLSRLSKENSGSSGCVRHTDQDITFLYNIIRTEDNVRYYITEDYLPPSKDWVNASINTSIPMSSLALIYTGEYFAY